MVLLYGLQMHEKREKLSNQNLQCFEQNCRALHCLVGLA